MASAVPMGRRRGRSSAGQDSSPVLSNPKPSSHNTMRRLSSSSKRRSSITANVKDSKPTTYAEDEDSDSPIGPDGEVPAPKSKGGKRGISKDTYQCEVCRKWYRHSACLIKHRWQHTEYWQHAAALQMTKHQTVALLETAAILTSGSSLPEEKSFWPAAVSPPTSGLLGCETLNTETLNRMPYGSFSSSMKSSVPTIPSKLNSQAGSTDSENATDPDNEDDEEELASREEDMFAMEEDLPPASGMVSGMEEDYAQPGPPRQAPAHPLFKMQRSTVPLLPSHYSQSAPALGFFAPRSSQHEAIIIEDHASSKAQTNNQFDTEMAF